MFFNITGESTGSSGGTAKTAPSSTTTMTIYTGNINPSKTKVTTPPKTKTTPPPSKTKLKGKTKEKTPVKAKKRLVKHNKKVSTRVLSTANTKTVKKRNKF